MSRRKLGEKQTLKKEVDIKFRISHTPVHGRTPPNPSTAAGGLSSIARTSLALTNFKIGPDHFGLGEATSFWKR
jgi:hypothetical protein